MGEQGALSVHRRKYSVTGAREDDEKRIALRVDFVASVRGERRPEQALVLCEDLVPALAEVLYMARRTLDIGEEEGDYTGW
jgi:hypothetical protein